MILIPLLGWAMVSTSSYGLPTMFFTLFEWPHLSFLSKSNNELFNISHKYASFLMIFLLFIHIGAALKHQFIEKDKLIKIMLP
jgi:cytochrome b561